MRRYWILCLFLPVIRCRGKAELYFSPIDISNVMGFVLDFIVTQFQIENPYISNASNVDDVVYYRFILKYISKI